MLCVLSANISLDLRAAVVNLSLSVVIRLEGVIEKANKISFALYMHVYLQGAMVVSYLQTLTNPNSFAPRLFVFVSLPVSFCSYYSARRRNRCF